jgi:hypothetical protein
VHRARVALRSAASRGCGRHPSNGRASEPASHSARCSAKATVAVAAIHPPATARSSAIAVQEVVNQNTIRKLIVSAIRPALFDRHVITLEVSGVVQASAEKMLPPNWGDDGYENVWLGIRL